EVVIDLANGLHARPATVFVDVAKGFEADVRVRHRDEVANGIVEALSRVTIDSPIVIRLDGTNAEEGREILRPHLSDTLQMQPTMLEAAAKVVELAGS
ncbi:MAG TPA: HPr family phosphocarrier protein, partial [Microthrixaceae bacterium]|nr:HPr family phosphocarrier protein [Microthrixaceae bacterium]